MSFRGINTTVIQIRRQVFTEVARMAYANVKGEKANHLMRKIPYTIIPGEEGKLRKDIFLERAIVEERVRLAMGLPTRRMDEHNSVVSGLEDASIADKYYDPPLVNVIKFACNRCPEKLVKVSDLCQGHIIGVAIPVVELTHDGNFFGLRCINTEQITLFTILHERVGSHVIERATIPAGIEKLASLFRGGCCGFFLHTASLPLQPPNEGKYEYFPTVCVLRQNFGGIPSL